MTGGKFAQHWPELHPEARRRFGTEPSFPAKIQFRAETILKMTSTIMSLAAELTRAAQGFREEARAIVTYAQAESRSKKETAGD